MAISPDGTTIALGTQEGNILLYKSKNFFETDAKDSVIPGDKGVAINRIFFGKDKDDLHLFYTSKSGVFALQKLQVKKEIFQNSNEK